MTGQPALTVDARSTYADVCAAIARSASTQITRARKRAIATRSVMSPCTNLDADNRQAA